MILKDLENRNFGSEGFERPEFLYKIRIPVNSIISKDLDNPEFLKSGFPRTPRIPKERIPTMKSGFLRILNFGRS